jgi:hypothetical protein
LLPIQVGNQPPIGSCGLAPGATAPFNSIVDSGTNSLLVAQSVYEQFIASFGTINQYFATALTQFWITTNRSVGQNQIALATWPDLRFTLQGADGSPVVLTVAPGNYWQFDVVQQGQALA